MDFYDNTIKTGYLLWLHIKLLRNTIDYASGIVDIENKEDDFSDILELLIEKVNALLCCITNGDIINVMHYLGRNYNNNDYDQIWDYYELLIENLIQLLLLRDYDIVQNYSDFMDTTNGTLLFFENKLREKIVKVDKVQ